MIGRAEAKPMPEERTGARQETCEALALDASPCGTTAELAGRPKDREFCGALTERDLVDMDTLRVRLGMVKGLDDAVRERVRGLIESP